MAFSSAYATDGATFPAEIQRLANSAIAPDISGVIGVSDLLVRGLGAPGVSVDPGAAIAANTYPLASFRQSYLVANESADGDAILPVPAAGSAAARTDYLIYRIFDEEYAGQSDPTGKGGGLVLVKSLPTTYPFVALAKIVQPAGNTAGIQQNMITDLRDVAFRKLDPHTIGRPIVTGDKGLILNVKGGTGEMFPDIGSAVVKIPTWATRARIEAFWDEVIMQGGSWGLHWMEFGPNQGASVWKYSTQKWGFYRTGGGTSRQTWHQSEEVAIPADIRGTSQGFFFKANYSVNTTDTGVSLDVYSGVTATITFMNVIDKTVREIG